MKPNKPLSHPSSQTVARDEPIRFDAPGGWWYGHGFAHRQPYPLNREAVVNETFAVNNTQSPIWLCSSGYAVLAETRETLSVHLDTAGHLEIRCPTQPFTVRVFRGVDLPSAHRQLMAHLGWPGDSPGEPVLGDSFFCTWTQFPRCLTQPRVLDMARAIRTHDFPCSVITLDDRWEAGYGEMQFSAAFRDPHAMVRELHELGFKVWLWITPFFNQETAGFRQLANREYLVRRKDGNGPALLKWWGGTAGLIDLTNPAARHWFKERLTNLRQQFGVDGFKIDGGDAKYQPPVADAHWHDYRGASGYADELLALFEEIAPYACETRTVWLSQRRKILWRQGGKDSHWGVDNGLTALVNLALHMALMGYDILMPDMVPGRVQTMVATLPLPTDELLVRWTEVSAFLPLLQFSYFPWNYANPAAEAVRELAWAHKAIAGYLHDEAHGRTAPLVRPLWYDWPHVAEFYTVADEYLLGSDLLVAPVLAENQTTRDVLLPPGAWRDAWTGAVCEQRMLAQHPAPCPGIPLFVRAANEPLFAVLHDRLKRIARGAIRSGTTSATYSAGVDRDLTVTG